MTKSPLAPLFQRGAIADYRFLFPSNHSKAISTSLQLRNVITHSRLQLILRAKSQLRARPRDVHSWTRGSKFSAGYLNSREYFFQRLFDIFDRGQSTAAQVVYLM